MTITMKELENPEKYRKVSFDEVTLGPIVLVTYYRSPSRTISLIRHGNIIEKDDNYIKFKNARATATSINQRYSKNVINNSETDLSQPQYYKLYKRRENEKLYDYVKEMQETDPFANDPYYLSSLNKIKVLNNPYLVNEIGDYLGGKKSRKRKGRRTKKQSRRRRKRMFFRNSAR